MKTKKEGREHEQLAFSPLWLKGLAGAQLERAEAVIELLRPLREKSLELLKDRAYLEDVMAKGAQKARDITDAKVMDIYDRLGFVRRR